MRVVVTGSTGRLGRALVAAATAAGHHVTGLARTEAQPCDLTDESDVFARIGAVAPDLVIHAAGATDVDGCERDPALAQLLNVDATRHVVDAAAVAGAHVVYVSTNHVFDGTAADRYREGDPTHPRSVYGATQLAGEELAGPDATIVRTAWLWSPAGGIVPAILAAARSGQPMRFADDEVAQPTAASDLAPVLLRLGEARVDGCFHAVGEGAVSSFDLARSVLVELGEDPGRVEPVAGADLPGRVAERPRNGVLDTARLAATGGTLPHHLQAIRSLVHGGTAP
ncbi:MAG: SDR family oxidoreductase, partial [Aquihabitans sp.]